MKMTKWILIAAAFVGGVYIASEEGKQIRKALEKKKSAFKPIINDLLEQAGKVLKGAESIKSSEIRSNIEKLISEAKSSLTQINLELTMEAIKDAIKMASHKIREAFSEVGKHQDSESSSEKKSSGHHKHSESEKKHHRKNSLKKSKIKHRK